MAFEIQMALDVSTDAATDVEDEPQNFNAACAGWGQERTAGIGGHRDNTG